MPQDFANSLIGQTVTQFGWISPAMDHRLHDRESHPSNIFVDKLNHLIIILLLPSRKLACSVIKIICLLRCQCNPKQERSELPLAATPSFYRL